MAENGCPNFRGLFATKVIKSHLKLHVKSDADKVNYSDASYSPLLQFSNFPVFCLPRTLELRHLLLRFYLVFSELPLRYWRKSARYSLRHRFQNCPNFALRYFNLAELSKFNASSGSTIYSAMVLFVFHKSNVIASALLLQSHCTRM